MSDNASLFPFAAVGLTAFALVTTLFFVPEIAHAREGFEKNMMIRRVLRDQHGTQYTARAVWMLLIIRLPERRWILLLAGKTYQRRLI